MKVFLVLLLAGLSAGDQRPYQPYNQNALSYPPASYQFSWSVQDAYSGNDYGHTENREGQDTEGEYHVLLPDGRVQTVTYSVDPYSGFQAKVLYDGSSQSSVTPNPYKPIPSPYRPTPNTYKPTPSPYKPTPSPYKPTPRPYTPKPIYNSYNPAPAPSYHRAYTFIPAPTSYTPTYPKTTVAPSYQSPSYNHPSPPKSEVKALPPSRSHFSSGPSPSVFSHAPAQSHAHFAPQTSHTQQPANSHGHQQETSHAHEPASGHAHKSSSTNEVDPYLRTEEELKGRDFDKTFYYEYYPHKKVKNKGKKAKDHNRI